MEIRKIDRGSYEIPRLERAELEKFERWITRLPEDQVTLQLGDTSYQFWSVYERTHFVSGLRLGLGLA
jgi:hypothetical protein